METRRAHERITSLEVVVKAHIDSHKTLEDGLAENTRLTKTISENTAEIVALIKGVKWFRSFLLWVAPLAAAVAAAWTWLKMQAAG